MFILFIISSRKTNSILAHYHFYGLWVESICLEPWISFSTTAKLILLSRCSSWRSGGDKPSRVWLQALGTNYFVQKGCPPSVHLAGPWSRSLAILTSGLSLQRWLRFCQLSQWHENFAPGNSDWEETEWEHCFQSVLFETSQGKGSTSCESHHKPTSVTTLLNMMCVNNVQLCDRKAFSDFF